MTDINTLLAQANIRHAIVVDDAFDPVPVASDLSVLDADEWTNFFDDLTDDDRVILREIFHEYDDSGAEDLQNSDAFVAILWGNRHRFRDELTSPLFARYEADAATDTAYLEALVNRLNEFGLNCDTAGRNFHEKAGQADLIIIDLFLGLEQNEEAIRMSIAGLTQVINARPARPPLVILMSRSPRLENKRMEFRDQSGLFESAFRILRKSDISDPGKLQRVLIRLATHYGESLKLATFLYAWKRGIQEATEQAAQLIRTLDLPDHAQIHQLLLSAEGEPTGSYLVDVFDRVLQHETERSASTIDAAIALNTLTTETYPPPYIAGSRDLQDLVYRSLFQNNERLRLIGAVGSRVAFGDTIRRKPQPEDPQQGEGQLATALSNFGASDILLVLTPACDLQRQGAKRVLLLAGKLQTLTPSDWAHDDNSARTPVIKFADGSRSWIKWNLRHIETVSHTDLEQALDSPAGFEVVARLRESHALELQQRLLSSLGRVGQIALMPATFPMRVEAYLPDLQKKPLISVLSATDGVCYVGRGGLKEMRLILPEDTCDALCEGVESIDLTGVYQDAHGAVDHLRTTSDLMEALVKGVMLPAPVSGELKGIPSPTGATEGDGANPRIRTIGLICRNKATDNFLIPNSELRKAGIILVTYDIGDLELDYS